MQFLNKLSGMFALTETLADYSYPAIQSLSTKVITNQSGEIDQEARLSCQLIIKALGKNLSKPLHDFAVQEKWLASTFMKLQSNAKILEALRQAPAVQTLILAVQYQPVPKPLWLTADFFKNEMTGNDNEKLANKTIRELKKSANKLTKNSPDEICKLSEKDVAFWIGVIEATNKRLPEIADSEILLSEELNDLLVFLSKMEDFSPLIRESLGAQFLLCARIIQNQISANELKNQNTDVIVISEKVEEVNNIFNSPTSVPKPDFSNLLTGNRFSSPTNSPYRRGALTDHRERGSSKVGALSQLGDLSLSVTQIQQRLRNGESSKLQKSVANLDKKLITLSESIHNLPNLLQELRTNTNDMEANQLTTLETLLTELKESIAKLTSDTFGEVVGAKLQPQGQSLTDIQTQLRTLSESIAKLTTDAFGEVVGAKLQPQGQSLTDIQTQLRTLSESIAKLTTDAFGEVVGAKLQPQGQSLTDIQTQLRTLSESIEKLTTDAFGEVVETKLQPQGQSLTDIQAQLKTLSKSISELTTEAFGEVVETKLQPHGQSLIEIQTQLGTLSESIAKLTTEAFGEVVRNRLLPHGQSLTDIQTQLETLSESIAKLTTEAFGEVVKNRLRPQEQSLIEIQTTLTTLTQKMNELGRLPEIVDGIKQAVEHIQEATPIDYLKSEALVPMATSIQTLVNKPQLSLEDLITALNQTQDRVSEIHHMLGQQLNSRNQLELQVAKLRRNLKIISVIGITTLVGMIGLSWLRKNSNR